MVLALGWHRQNSMLNDDDSEKRRKLVLFWMFFIIDKGLTLRSGQSAIIQDHDIELPLPWADSGKPYADLERLGVWATSNRLLDLVYQKLYCPGALRQPPETRSEAVQDLLSQVFKIEPSVLAKVSRPIKVANVY